MLQGVHYVTLRQTNASAEPVQTGWSLQADTIPRGIETVATDENTEEFMQIYKCVLLPHAVNFWDYIALLRDGC